MSTKSRKRKQIENKKRKYSFEFKVLGGLGFVEHLRIAMFPKKKRSTIRGRMFRDELKVYALNDLYNKITIPLVSEYKND